MDDQPQNKPWLTKAVDGSLWAHHGACTEFICNDRRVTIGKARAILIEACGSGEVRSATQRGVSIPARKWHGATIDGKRVLCANNSDSFQYPNICVSELRPWLDQNYPLPKPATEAAERPSRHFNEESANKFTKDWIENEKRKEHRPTIDGLRTAALEAGKRGARRLLDEAYRRLVPEACVGRPKKSAAKK
jgi:hypothetical protein